MQQSASSKLYRNINFLLCPCQSYVHLYTYVWCTIFNTMKRVVLNWLYWFNWSILAFHTPEFLVVLPMRCFHSMADSNFYRYVTIILYIVHNETRKTVENTHGWNRNITFDIVGYSFYYYRTIWLPSERLTLSCRMDNQYFRSHIVQ